MLSPAIWLVCITPILPHARVASLRTDVTAGPGSAWQGLFQDEALGGIPASGVQEHGLTQAVPWEIPNQAVPAAVREQVTPLSRDLWGWNPALHPSTPCSLTHAQHTPGQRQYSWEPKREEQGWG